MFSITYCGNQFENLLVGRLKMTRGPFGTQQWRKNENYIHYEYLCAVR